MKEDECNDKYGRIRMHQALKRICPPRLVISGERTIYKIMRNIGIKKLKRKSKGLTKADKEAQKTYDLIKRNFRAEAPLKKWVTDITKIKGKDGNLYVSAIFDC